MQNKKLLNLVLAGFLLAACSSSNKLAEVKLPGERISLFEIEKEEKGENDTLNSLGAAEINTSWSQPGYNPAHLMGHYKLNLPLSLKWDFDLGSEIDEDTPYLPEPVVSENHVFVLNAEGVLTKLDKKTGDEIWEKKLAADHKNIISRGGISYQNEQVFVSLGSGSLYAISATNGDILWQQTKFEVPLKSPPTLYEGRAFVITIDEKLYALDQKTGEILWQYTNIAEPAASLKIIRPAARFNTIIGAFNSGDIVALRAETGLVNWTSNSLPFKKTTSLALNNINTSPVFDEEGILASNQRGTIAFLSVKTGKAKWQKPYKLASTPIVFDGYIFALTESGEVIALDKEDGERIWGTQLDMGDKDDRTTWTAPVLADNHLLLFNDQGDIALINARDGKVTKKTFFEDGSGEDDVYSSSIIADGWLFHITRDGTLKAFH